MLIRTHAKAAKEATGIPKAGAIVSQGRNPMGAPEVTIFISAFDCFDIPSVVASLRLSPSEARHLAAGLLGAADKSEKT